MNVGSKFLNIGYQSVNRWGLIPINMNLNIAPTKIITQSMRPLDRPQMWNELFSEYAYELGNCFAYCVSCGYFGCSRIHMGLSSTNCVFFGCILPMPLSALLTIYGHFGCSRIHLARNELLQSTQFSYMNNFLTDRKFW